MADCAASRYPAIVSPKHFKSGGTLRAGEWDHAAAGPIGSRKFARGLAQQAMEGSPGVGVGIEFASKPFTRAFHVGFGGLLIQVLLAAERIVEAGSADAHHESQIIESGALVAALPEQLHRLLQGNGAVEVPRPATGASQGLGYLCGHRSKPRADADWTLACSIIIRAAAERVGIDSSRRRQGMPDSVRASRVASAPNL
jgi:hypothetical protein